MILVSACDLKVLAMWRDLCEDPTCIQPEKSGCWGKTRSLQVSTRERQWRKVGSLRECKNILQQNIPLNVMLVYDAEL